MALKYVLAGTNGWFSDTLNVLLMNAVKTQWTATITDPPVANVNFNTSWFTDSEDTEFSFINLRDDTDPRNRDIAWNRRNTTTFVDVHMWIRGGGISGQPIWLSKAKKAFEDIIELNNTTLIPNTVVTIDSADYIPDRDHLATVYHLMFSIRIGYDKVKVDTP